MKKNKIASTILQGALLVAFAGGFYYITQTQVKPVQVYQYSRTIQEDTLLTEADFEKVTIPRDAITDDMLLDISEGIDKVTETKVYKGEYVNKQALLNKDDVDPFKALDLSNYRKVSIPVTMQEAIGGNIKAGDKIDLAYIDSGVAAKDGKEEEYIYAKTFMQEVLVYNVLDGDGKKYIDLTEGTTIPTDENGEPIASGTLSTIILCVSAEQAEEIEARSAKGKIKPIGRFEESIDSNTNGFTIGTVGDVVISKDSPEN